MVEKKDLWDRLGLPRGERLAKAMLTFLTVTPWVLGVTTVLTAGIAIGFLIRAHS